jgi:chromosome segregation ATPase
MSQTAATMQQQNEAADEVQAQGEQITELRAKLGAKDSQITQLQKALVNLQHEKDVLQMRYDIMCV